MKIIIEIITPEMAKAYLLRNKSNRKVSRQHVARLARCMKAGKFRLTHQGIAFDEDGNMIDGQHRLLAIIESGCSIQMSVARGVKPEDKLLIDIQSRPRSYSDALSIERGTDSIKQLVAACRLLINLKTGERVPTLDEVRQFMDENKSSLDFADEIAAGNKILKNACVLSMMALAHKAGHAEEIENWAAVMKSGVASEAWHTSATRLREYHFSSKHTGGFAKREEFCRRVYTSMAAWIERRPLAKLYARERIEWLSSLDN